jgi:hypothetical protein
MALILFAILGMRFILVSLLGLYSAMYFIEAFFFFSSELLARLRGEIVNIRHVTAMYACSHVTTRKPLQGFTWNLMPGSFT